MKTAADWILAVGTGAIMLSLNLMIIWAANFNITRRKDPPWMHHISRATNALMVIGFTCISAGIILGLFQ